MTPQQMEELENAAKAAQRYALVAPSNWTIAHSALVLDLIAAYREQESLGKEYSAQAERNFYGVQALQRQNKSLREIAEQARDSLYDISNSFQNFQGKEWRAADDYETAHELCIEAAEAGQRAGDALRGLEQA